MMQGYTTNYVNLIADNLRDRYESGLPILKELVQNADDAKASTLIFGSHDGFPDAPHPLLRGPALWFLNDGQFKTEDKAALRSFGINSKAGDAEVIGKFGLGMKSVFHLCEALFYVAWDEQEIHREGLTPWKQDGQTLHPEWDETVEKDWDRLTEWGAGLAPDECRSWFLLWLPLRRRVHLRAQDGEELGAIINRFPGDDLSRELAFLNEEGLAHDLGEMLPLLRHLQQIEHKGKDNPFVLRITGDGRLMGEPPRERTHGRVVKDENEKRPLLVFSGSRLESPDTDGWFARMRKREEWPRTRYRDQQGREKLAVDKTAPEGAVLFCSAPAGTREGRLHWAVFLPVEAGSEPLLAGGGRSGHSLVLHGQFFLDAGRRKIHGLEHLHREPGELGDGQIDDSVLRRIWNQRLAQDVVLPLVLPALERYVDEQSMPDKDCVSLTSALAESDWFKTFRPYVCGDGVWMRTLTKHAGPAWRLIRGEERGRLRPVPPPPQSAPARPWQAFPELEALNVLPYDAEAPCLWDGPRQWQEAELIRLLSRVDGLFTDDLSMGYLEGFLATCAGPYLGTESLQLRFLALLRDGMQAAPEQARRQVATKARRVIGFVEPQRRLTLSGDLPEPVLRQLWGVDAPVLLVPKAMEPELPGKGVPGEQTLGAWLGVLDLALAFEEGEAAREAILGVVQALLRTLEPADRGRFLRVHRWLRVIAVRDARAGAERPVSYDDLEQLRGAGTLFGFAEGLAGRQMGLTPLLARVLPDADVCLVRAPVYRELFPDGGPEGGGDRIPSASDGRACLAAVGKAGAGQLGSLSERRALLEQANDPGADRDAVRGLRLLLHGSVGYRQDDQATLWVGRHDQHSAWTRLWGALHEGEKWSLVNEELANAVPRGRWAQAGIAEIDARSLVDELQRTGKGIAKPESFSVEERDEILSAIDPEDLWRRLPLHTTVDGAPVSAAAGGVYLAPESGGGDDPLTARVTLIAPSLDPRVAEQQRGRLRALDDRARMEIALGADDPSAHYRVVLGALHRLPSTEDPDLASLLRGKAWLRTTDGAPVTPEDVIDIRGALADEACRLVAEHRAAHGACFAVPDELDGAVRSHPAWPRLREVGFSAAADGLERLALLLEDLPAYHIGSWQAAPAPDTLALLARCDTLPGWRLLAAAAADPGVGEKAWDSLGKGLARGLEPDVLRGVLDWLSEDTEDWDIRKRAYDAYLRQLAQHEQAARDCLPDLRLASYKHRWRMAPELCTGAHGVDPDRLLDENQASILGNLIHGAGAGAAGQPRVIALLPEAGFQLARQSAPEILREYFGDWDASLVPAPMIGMVLGMLGPGLRLLAEQYLYPHSFDWLVGRLRWTDPGGTAQRRNWMGGKAIREALSLIEAGVQIQAGDEAEVRNLLGQSMRVDLDKEVRTLLAGALSWQGGYGVMIPLRRVDPTDFRPEWLHDLLRATAERLYGELYNQVAVDFGDLWRELDRSDQLEIGVARRLVLDHVPFYLRQLSVRSESINARLEQCDSSLRRVAEAEREADGRPLDSLRKAQREALERLAKGIDETPQERQAVMDAVKAKLRQYQYDLSSIPLELFQNADDAVVEQGYFHAHPLAECKILPEARRFVVEERGDVLRFLHWGRPVNARGPVGFRAEGRGYERDLEKMLILSVSDKHREEGVTGKFGLGFKSVLLACDQPKVLSGRLAVRVVSGILPQPWDDAREARARLAHHGRGSRLVGTLIELPEVAPEVRNQVLDRFRQLAGVLCVFGRAVRSVTYTGTEEWTREWKPQELCSGIEVGQLDLAGEWGARTTALCVRAEHGSLLMAMEPRGFRPLPEEIPALWVTAPTREGSGVGFAVNGSFDLDAGRGRLAGNTAENRVCARRIGEEAGDALGGLLDRSRHDWDGVRSSLRLAADVEALGFWESLWTGLTRGWLGQRRSDQAELAREAALGALVRLGGCPQGVPNGLKAALRGFVNAADIRYQMDGAFLHADVAGELAAWPRFASRYPSTACVSENIGAIVTQSELAKPQPLGLPAVLAVLDRNRVEPADAAVLGRVWRLTEEHTDWESDEVEERLHELLFRSEVDDWVPADELLAASGGVGPDEPRRHALAPTRRRLHPVYYEEDDLPAVDFFLVCRPRLEASAEEIARWVLDAQSEEVRRTALEYLADGELGDAVAGKVRGQGWLQAALNEPRLMAHLSEEQVETLRRRLVSCAQLQLAVDAYWQQGLPHVHSQVDLPTALQRLHHWWSQEGSNQAREYRDRLYPGPLNLQPDASTGRIDRPSWLTLLAVGSFQGMGRTREQQHRGFIRLCQQKGWWQVFAERDPQDRPDQWMNIIEEYAEAQHDDEAWAQWMGQFPKLYRLSRWLEDYKDLLLSIDRFNQAFSLEAILAPRANPNFQGGGIDAPPLTRTLKVGAHLVVRELLHHGVISNPLAVPHAYAPTERIKGFFQAFDAWVYSAEEIHKILKEYLGEERATFDRDYDIPLRIIASDDALQQDLLE